MTRKENQGMGGRDISVTVNETPRRIASGLPLGVLRDRVKPGADVLLRNGCPCDEDLFLQDGDRVVFIKRGEIPAAEELEALMAARHTPGIHARLKQGIVGVAGLGGLGSMVAVALARVGVGTLILADFDVVEPSNLNRQQYDIDHIGMPKTAAMAAVLDRINPYLTVRLHQERLDSGNIPVIFRDVTVLVECFDRADQKAMLVESASEGLPDVFIIGGSGMAGFGDGNRIQTTRVGEKLFISGDLTTAAAPGCGLMAPRVGIAACHQANLAINLLIDPENVVF